MDQQNSQKKTTDIIEETLEKKIKGKQHGMRFYVTSKMKIMSSTIAAYMNKCSVINFHDI